MVNGTNGQIARVTATRLRPRALPPGHIPRPQLHSKFGLSSGAKVTIVAAPPGSGKTTIVREWLEDLPAGTWVWLSLGPDENDVVPFWSALIECIRQVHPSVGDDALRTLSNSALDDHIAIASLVDDLCDLPSDPPLVVVLDDLHRTRATPVQQLLASFVEQLPDHVHLVITTRVDPALPIALMRARGEVAELRGPDLAFNDRDAISLLTASGLVDADHDDLRLLNQMTEGWVVGLRLAGVALRQADDHHEFVRSFGGWEYSIAEFLLDEVLRGMDPQLRKFVVQTSVVDAVNPSLCRAVTGREDSAEVLHTLATDQLFVERLEGDGQWYRYHHMFADLLHLEVQHEGVDAVRGLHHRAAVWYDAHGRAADAVRHAILSADERLVLGLLQRHHLDLAMDGKSALVRQATAAISQAFITADIDRALAFGEVLASAGLAGPIQDLLLRIGRDLDDTDVESTARLHLLRGIVAAFAGNLREAVDHITSVSRLLGRVPTDALGLRSRLNLGRSYLLADRYDDARATLEEVVSSTEAPALLLAAAEGALAEIDLEMGELVRAGRRANRAVEMWRSVGAPPQVAMTDALRALAATTLEAGDVGGARSLLQESLDQTTLFLPGAPRLITLSHLALLEAHLGRGDAALAHLLEGRSAWSELRPGPELLARYGAASIEVHLLLGDTPGARACLAELAEVAPISVGRRAILVATTELADGNADTALEHVASLHPTTVAQRVDLALLQARVHHRLGHAALARAATEEALAVGLPHGYSMTFAWYPALWPIYESVQHDSPSPGLARVIALTRRGRQTAALPGTPEVLSERETELLALLPTHLSNPELAALLFVSTNTVKTHLRNIYRKLFVASRSEAVARARELGLLT